MHRSTFIAAFAIFAVITTVMLSTAGCGNDMKGMSAKPIFKPSTDDKLPPVAGEKPVVADATSMTAVKKLLAAHTGDNPTAIAAFQNCKVSRKGEMCPDKISMPAECSDCFAWPQRSRNELTCGTTSLRFLIDGAAGTVVRGGIPQSPTSTELTNMLEDCRGTWMTLLVPLTDPSLVAALAPEAPAELTALRVWLGSQPPHLLIIDAKTGLLSRVVFDKESFGKGWSFILSDYKIVRGVKLPGKVVYNNGEKNIATWTEIDYQLVTAFPADTFTKP